MLYRSLRIAACLLSSAAVASADDLSERLRECQRQNEHRGERTSIQICRELHRAALEDREAVYREQTRQRDAEVRRMQRARRANNYW